MKTLEWGLFSFNEVFSTDLRNRVRILEIPTYFFSGKYYYTVNHDLSKVYLAELQAPVRGFYSFEDSAHRPFLEEPDRFRKILREDVLAGETNYVNLK